MKLLMRYSLILMIAGTSFVSAMEQKSDVMDMKKRIAEWEAESDSREIERFKEYALRDGQQKFQKHCAPNIFLALGMTAEQKGSWVKGCTKLKDRAENGTLNNDEYSVLSRNRIALWEKSNNEKSAEEFKVALDSGEVRKSEKKTLNDLSFACVGLITMSASSLINYGYPAEACGKIQQFSRILREYEKEHNQDNYSNLFE
ncbi:hypothetical protein HYX58_02120 [Candidatus Dependentiae bacterium]|nr:hypothetical protein [Candidatus Dependentiae bacterium]